MDKLEEMSPEDKANFRLPEEMLTPVHLRCVERIYGEQGPDIRDLMLKNPAVAIPVVMTRLRQKDDEWRKVRGTDVYFFVDKPWGAAFSGTLPSAVTSIVELSFWVCVSLQNGLQTASNISAVWCRPLCRLSVKLRRHVSESVTNVSDLDDFVSSHSRKLECTL